VPGRDSGGLPSDVSGRRSGDVLNDADVDGRLASKSASERLSTLPASLSPPPVLVPQRALRMTCECVARLLPAKMLEPPLCQYPVGSQRTPILLWIAGSDVDVDTAVRMERRSDSVLPRDAAESATDTPPRDMSDSLPVATDDADVTGLMQTR
jgi:hypothetical protein